MTPMERTMNKTLSTLMFAGMLVATGACDRDLTSPDQTLPPLPEVDPTIPDTYFDQGMTLESSSDRRVRRDASGTRVDVVTFADPDRVVGRSRLRRGQRAVQARLTAGELPPRTATTLWAVVFNNPDACVGECDDPDLFDNPATQADLMYLAGNVANGSGRVGYSAQLRERATENSIMPLFGLPSWGVIDTRRAEIHLIVRTHGEVLEGLRHAQISTFNGGCSGMGPEFGTPGPNTCEEPYFASHYAGLP